MQKIGYKNYDIILVEETGGALDNSESVEETGEAIDDPKSEAPIQEAASEIQENTVEIVKPEDEWPRHCTIPSIFEIASQNFPPELAIRAEHKLNDYLSVPEFKPSAA